MEQNQQAILTEIRHSVLIDDRPVDEKNIGASTNRLKRRGYSTYEMSQDIIQAMADGRPVILAGVEMIFKNAHDSHLDIDNKRFGFLHTSIFAIKVQDEYGRVSPDEVFQSLGSEATALIFTKRHLEESLANHKKHDYFILFQLDRALNTADDMVELGRFFRQRLLEQFPVWKAETVQVLRPTILLSGGQSAKVENYSNVVKTKGYLDRLYQQRLQNEKNKLEWLTMQGKKADYIPPFDELQRMAEYIGNIQKQSPNLWPKIVTSLKNHELLGLDLSPEQGLKLFRLLSNETEADSIYLKWSANGKSTIGTLIEHAQKRDYQRSEFINVLGGTSVQDLPVQTLKVDRYLTAPIAKDFIRSGNRILLDSPTGSGKTTAILTAAKELSAEQNDNHFFLFIVPTTSLVDQLTQKHGLFGLQGGMTKTKQKINKEITDGRRCFISTYDKAKELVDMIGENLGNSDFSFTLVIDEVHKMVSDYDFRSNAILSLAKLFDAAHTLIGLSGTTEDVLATSFEKKLVVDNGEAQSPCNEFTVYEYTGLKKQQLDALQDLIIERVRQGKKLLVFLQNKNHVKTISQWLRKNKVQADYLDGESKTRNVYKKLMKTECFPDGIQVLLCTSVAADGININNPINCECLVICTSLSDLANPSGIKQMSNRFRNSYDRFSLFIEAPKHDEMIHFNIDKAFDYRLRSAKKIVSDLDAHLDRSALLQYDGAFLEKKYGISYSNGGPWEINQLLLRHQSSQDKTRYYTKHRKALIKATEQLLNQSHKSVPLGSTTQVERNATGSQKKTFTPFAVLFTKEVYTAYRMGYSAEIRIFEEQLTSCHQKAIRFLYPLTDYESCLALVQLISNEQKRAQLEYRIKNLVDVIIDSQLTKAKAGTFRVCQKIEEITDYLSSKDWKLEFHKISKACRVDQRLVEVTAKLYFIKSNSRSKDKKVRLSQLNLLNIENVATTYNLEPSQLASILVKYADLHLTANRKALLTRGLNQFNKAS